MHWHFVLLATFFVESQPPACAVLKHTLTSSPPRSATGTLGLLTLGLAGSFFNGAPLIGLELTTVRPFHMAAWIEDFPGHRDVLKLRP